MKSPWTPRRFASHIYRSRPARLVMLLLAVVSVPSVGAGAMQRPHCTLHEHSAGADHRTDQPHHTTWQSSTPHECPHCPATECAHAVPCTTSASPVITAAVPVIAEPSGDQVG